MSTPSRALWFCCAAMALACVMGVSACGGSDHKKKEKKKAASTTSLTAPTPTKAKPKPKPHPKTKPKPKPKPPSVDPLTGGKPSSGSVVAVKIDDTAEGRPQAGINSADIVYIEQVEGGLTRTIAIFHSRKPGSVGPVRSVRANDPELLTQYGRISFVASGGGGDSLPALDKSILRGDINDRGGSGFFRDGSRSVPHNLMLRLGQVTGGAPAKPIGFAWSASMKGLAHARPAAGLDTFVGSTPVQFRWDSARKVFVRYINGVAQHAADGNLIATPNVIVQFTTGYINVLDVDQAGNPGWFTRSVGRGQVVVFRDGHAVNGRWTRSSAGSGTTMKDKFGHPIPLRPGGAWVVLATNGAPLR